MGGKLDALIIVAPFLTPSPRFSICIQKVRERTGSFKTPTETKCTCEKFNDIEFIPDSNLLIKQLSAVTYHWILLWFEGKVLGTKNLIRVARRNQLIKHTEKGKDTVDTRLYICT
jgi:hypothetical protein